MNKQIGETISIKYINYTVIAIVAMNPDKYPNHIKKGLVGKYFLARDNGRVIFEKFYRPDGKVYNSDAPLSTGIAIKDLAEMLERNYS